MTGQAPEYLTSQQVITRDQHEQALADEQLGVAKS